MTRYDMPVLACDAEDCDAWEVDWYGHSVSAVNGVPVTAARPAPGWTSASGEDRCPDHSLRSDTPD